MTEADREKQRKEIELIRHSWAEMAMRDVTLRRFPTALALVTYVRKRFRSDLGHAEFSLGGAEKELNMHRKSVVRARDKLIELGWLRLKARRMDQSTGWKANLYTLSGGLEDRLLDERSPSVTGDTLGRDITDDTRASVGDDTNPVS